MKVNFERTCDWEITAGLVSACLFDREVVSGARPRANIVILSLVVQQPSAPKCLGRGDLIKSRSDEGPRFGKALFQFGA